jgi:hypothetical protein
MKEISEQEHTEHRKLATQIEALSTILPFPGSHHPPPRENVSKYERGERRLDVIEFLDISSALKMDASDVVDALKEAGKSVKAKGGRV